MRVTISSDKGDKALSVSSSGLKNASGRKEVFFYEENICFPLCKQILTHDTLETNYLHDYAMPTYIPT